MADVVDDEVVDVVDDLDELHADNANVIRTMIIVPSVSTRALNCCRSPHVVCSRRFVGGQDFIALCSTVMSSRKDSNFRAQITASRLPAGVNEDQIVKSKNDF